LSNILSQRSTSIGVTTGEAIILGNSKFSEITYQGDRINGPDEVLEPPEIGARSATDMRFKTENVNASFLDPMDIDTDLMDIDIDTVGIDVLVEVDSGCKIQSATNIRASRQINVDQMDSVCAGDISLQISRTRINGPSLQSQAKQALKQKLPRYLEGRENVGFVATTAVPPLGNTSRERRHWSHGDTKAQRVTFLSNRLIGDGPIDTFAANCEKTFLDWIKLLSRVTLPEDIQSTDPRIMTAFKAVDSVIRGQGINALQRLAHVQLLRLFDLLEAIVKTDRVTGRIHRERHYRDHHVAMDIYMSAQEAHSNTNDLRTKIRTCRKRLSNRWSVLAKASPLFVLVYSDAAESIVYVPPSVKYFIS
jgi:hypothetical protein